MECGYDLGDGEEPENYKDDGFSQVYEFNGFWVHLNREEQMAVATSSFPVSVLLELLKLAFDRGTNSAFEGVETAVRSVRNMWRNERTAG